MNATASMSVSRAVTGAPKSQGALRARRLPAAKAGALLHDTADALGVLGVVGCAARGTPPAVFGLPSRPLLDTEPQVDAWSGGPLVARGCHGSVHWRHDGQWLFGSLVVDDAAAPGLEAAMHAAYTEVFGCLRATGMPALLRVWNYLPGINDEARAEGEAIERYRQFNAGRQRAFLEAGAAAFDGAPAACALGTRSGPMCISFLAGRHPALAIENPRQTSAYRYPPRYGAKSPSFSRAALLNAGGGRVALLVSGTSSIVGHESVHAGDVVAQTRETFANLYAVIDAANARGHARFALADLACTIYVRHADEAAAVRALFDAEVGTDSVAAREAIVVEADICREDLRVEIEAHGFAPGEVAA